MSIPSEGMPWEQDEEEGGANYKYKYHPGGDPNNQPREAPGALHSHTIMAALPRELHEKYNKQID